MPTTVGILTLATKISCSIEFEHEKSFETSGPDCANSFMVTQRSFRIIGLKPRFKKRIKEIKYFGYIVLDQLIVCVFALVWGPEFLDSLIVYPFLRILPVSPISFSGPPSVVNNMNHNFYVA